MKYKLSSYLPDRRRESHAPRKPAALLGFGYYTDNEAQPRKVATMSMRLCTPGGEPMHTFLAEFDATDARRTDVREFAKWILSHTQPLMRLYDSWRLPDTWIGTDEYGALFQWPAVKGGWHQRSPYVGTKAALREIEPHKATGTSWPGAIKRDEGRSVSP